MREYDTDGIIVGRPYQTVHEASTTQKYPIGTIFDAFGLRYRYCRCKTAIVTPHRGNPALIYAPWVDSVVVTNLQWGADAATCSGVEGENFFTLTFAAACDVARVKDIMQGGLMTVWDTLNVWQYRIIGNDASYEVASADDTMKVYVDPPLIQDFTDIPTDGLPSAYNFAGASGSVSTMYSVCVVSPIIVDAESFFWGQTRGPCWVTPTAGWTTASNRMCEFHTDGTIQASAHAGLQHAGYMLAANNVSDDAHIYLELE